MSFSPAAAAALCGEDKFAALRSLCDPRLHARTAPPTRALGDFDQHGYLDMFLAGTTKNELWENDGRANGRSVGIGFEWQTRTGLGNGGLAAVCTLARRVQRAFLSTGILSRQAETYLLKCRIVWIRTGEPNAVFRIEEG